VGLKLFGFWGMLLSPIAVIAIKLLLEGFFSGRNEKINKM
jgi:predicted PurR-regulated permease PerM